MDTYGKALGILKNNMNNFCLFSEKQFGHCKRTFEKVENPIMLGPLENNQVASNNSCGSKWIYNL